MRFPCAIPGPPAAIPGAHAEIAILESRQEANGRERMVGSFSEGGWKVGKFILRGGADRNLAECVGNGIRRTQVWAL